MQRIIGVGLLVCASTLFAAEEIGVVTSVTGVWCRGEQRGLNSGDRIFSEDKISYCDPTLVKTHSISIHFVKPKVYTRTYKCETPGVCQEGATLWLSDPIGLPGTRLIGRPPVLGNLSSMGKNGQGSLIVPDTIAYKGKINWAALASSHSDLMVCRWSAAKLSDCVSAQGRLSADTGIYALVAPSEMVTGVVAVANEAAPASNGWMVYPITGSPAELPSSNRSSILKLYLAEQNAGKGIQAAGKTAPAKAVANSTGSADRVQSNKATPHPVPATAAK
jgi:hypothetical protein